MPILLTIISITISLSYPLLVWLIFNYQQAQSVLACLLISIATLRWFLANHTSSKFFPSWFSKIVNIIMLTIGLSVLVFEQNKIFQIYPLFISIVFFVVFSISLFTEKSIVECFAELHEKNVSLSKKLYMRKVTVCWCTFFIINILISAYTWLAMSVSAWALYNGLISYFLMGLLFVSEFSYRHLVFLKK